jgi:hypothetical protein
LRCAGALEDGTEVAALAPEMEFLPEFPWLEEFYDRLPEAMREKLSPAMARKAATIVHVRFRK